MQSLSGMRYLQRFLFAASVITMGSSCYIHHHHRGILARRDCDRGYHLDDDGDRCVPDRPYYRRW